MGRILPDREAMRWRLGARTQARYPVCEFKREQKTERSVVSKAENQ
ncbi:hypothetical protein FP2506_11167 [Fulvimarina pelagi HTCC2506]|uniref:Uncharacterized protein n=1 Tax=Fulvimarina pelagi HTCC2506 TaxID=314231 RepID=Q0FZ46_9HYPH|nr:hypothetical protein FP2506_11167 [Fulvimarina pelagi HTCC2506]